MLFLSALFFHHEVVHFCLYFSDLKLEVRLLVFVAFYKLCLHRLELLLSRHEFLC
jgi:hypothetical protein